MRLDEAVTWLLRTLQVSGAPASPSTPTPTVASRKQERLCYCKHSQMLTACGCADGPQTTASPGQMPSGAFLYVLGGASVSGAFIGLGTWELAAGHSAQFLHIENGRKETPLSETLHKIRFSSCKCIHFPSPLGCTPQGHRQPWEMKLSPLCRIHGHCRCEVRDTEASLGKMRQDAYMGTDRTDAVGSGVGILYWFINRKRNMNL